jgi:excisionase family DNA binding protein
MESERLLTVEQLAGWLQVKPRTIYQWVQEEYIPVIKLGALLRFRQASVDEWIAKSEQPGRRQRKLSVEID